MLQGSNISVDPSILSIVQSNCVNLSSAVGDNSSEEAAACWATREETKKSFVKYECLIK